MRSFKHLSWTLVLVFAGFLVFPFYRIDVDNSGSIELTEFLIFCREYAASQSIEVDGLDMIDSLQGYLGPREASNGFKRASEIIAKKPSLASVPFTVAKWLPLHILLMLDTGECANAQSNVSNAARMATARANRAGAEPLIKALLKAYPEGAKVKEV